MVELDYDYSSILWRTIRRNGGDRCRSFLRQRNCMLAGIKRGEEEERKYAQKHFQKTFVKQGKLYLLSIIGFASAAANPISSSLHSVSSQDME